VIERIIAHEYFHNWSGNRVTCRDWFQLSLKEGLTRFRDQEFTRDMSAPDIKRIETVMRLRRDQFAEDQGPNSHCVQPDSYLQIQNFYTPTVYDKGAELVRMIYTLLGAELYFEGIALYIKRHDGQAVTIEDFLRAMEERERRSLKLQRSMMKRRRFIQYRRGKVAQRPPGRPTSSRFTFLCRWDSSRQTVGKLLHGSSR
jgi:aminopeptidase N